MSKAPLNQRLLDEPYEFEFFQAVRLFEKTFPELKPVGKEAFPNEEVLRFRSHVSLEFPASEIQEIREVADPQTDERRKEMVVNFMGMVGISGALPTRYSELVLDRIRQRDTTMWEFLDIFTHRAVSMFYRAWCKYRFPIGYERGNDNFTSYLFDIGGLGTLGLRGKMGIDDESLLPYLGLIAQKPHSANAVENLLGDFFQVPAKMIQFFGQWLDLDEADQTKLGVANSRLGTSAIIGTRIWDQQSKFRLRLGPLLFAAYQAFLPSGSAYRALKSITKFMVGEEFDFDVQLTLMAKQVPGLVLTTRAVRRPMLGWTSWLKTMPLEADADQLVLELAK
ncbi:MAG TPA: type VI secretion system baseplate subunit TssG [Pyrinomonadaceae bacterium]